MEARRLALLVLAASLATVALPAEASDPFPTAVTCDKPVDVAKGECLSPYAYEAYLVLDDLSDLPNDYTGGNVWKYSGDASGLPELDNDPRELDGVTGMSIDRAWLSSTGRPDVVIAVLDSGIRWQEPDLRLKAFLNRGELPAPRASSNVLDRHDKDFNGVFNVDDYAEDPRVSDLNNNGHLDAGDLIAAFSDGRDDDDNGFVDDISGWNFLDDTNDPFDEVDYGHGTGEAEDSTAEADNGGGFPGVCPSCRFVPLRVGQSFLAHDEDYAQAVLYAVDIGASVVQEALGTVDNVPLAQAAHRYAWDHGVALIASAADEAAYHHNFPSGHDFTINLNSIRAPDDISGVPAQIYPRSYLYVNGCTNFGGNIWASISSTSCSSEATGRGAGIAGLIVSHAKNLVARGELEPHPDADSYPGGSPLTSGEVRQLFRAAADDIDLSTKREVVSPIPTVRYASQPGWDQYTGWGRMNAERALGLLSAGVVPPDVAITSPGWWSAHDGLQTSEVPVTMEVNLRPFTGSTKLTLSFGCGVQPLMLHEFWSTTVSFGLPLGLKGPWTAPLPTQLVREQCPTTALPTTGPNDATITLSARVTLPDGVVGEDRRTVQVAHDATLADEWPVQLEASSESSPDMVDLDGDGLDELVVPTSGGFVHAFRIDGTELAGFPVTTDPMPGLHTDQPAFSSGALERDAYHDSISHGGTGIADVDDDGDLEIFATSLNGRVYAWDHTGTRLTGFPVTLDPAFADPSWRDEHNTVIHGIQAAPTLADLDADGDLEVVVAAMDRHVYAWHHDATLVAGFPVHLADTTMVDVDPVTHKVTPRQGVSAYRGAQVLSTTAVGDIDGDGEVEIVVGSNEHYDEELAVSALSVSSSLVSFTGILDTGNGRLFALEADGSYAPGFPIPVPNLAAELLPYVGEGIPGSPALGDLDGDGADEIVIFATVGPAMVYRGDGSAFYGNGPDGSPLPLTMELVGPLSGAVDVPVLPAVGSVAIGRMTPGSVQVVAPVAGVGRALDVALAGEQPISQDYTQAWDATTGLPLPAWPRPIEDLQFLTTPAIVNVDTDPLPEVVEGSGGYLLHAWDATGTESPGFPKATNHWLIGTPAVGDMDGDGGRELATTTREGWLWLWRTDASESLSVDEWWSDHHDEANTGRWASAPLPVTIASAEPVKASPYASLLLLLAGGLVAAAVRLRAQTGPR